MGQKELLELIDSLLPSPNLFYAVRVDGLFASVKTRSVARQRKPYPRLTEAVAKQAVFDLGEVRGTLVGFRCPHFVQGANLPGYHLHFLGEDRASGGHVLDCTTKDVVVSVDVTPSLHLALPTSEAFLTRGFEGGPSAGVQAVESGH